MQATRDTIQPSGVRGNMAEEMNWQQRHKVSAGDRVYIVQKQDQKSGKLTEGTVKEILTNSGFHPHGIKVRLECGSVGRVRKIISVD